MVCVEKNAAAGGGEAQTFRDKRGAEAAGGAGRGGEWKGAETKGGVEGRKAAKSTG